MLELINSPLYDHGCQPELEVTEPAIELMLGNVLWELRPNVVHANRDAVLKPMSRHAREMTRIYEEVISANAA